MTIHDLAQTLGLSISTVSKALNGRKDVSEEVRSRVRRMAEELGYIPNPQARKLALGESRTVGVYLLSRFGRPVGEYFGFQFLDGILKEAQDREIDILLFPEDPRPADYEAYARTRGVQGLIFIGLDQKDVQIPSLAKTDFPVVSIDTPIPGERRGFVSTDNRLGTRMLTLHLIERGCRDLVYLGMRGEGWVARERKAGVTEALAEASPKIALTYQECPLNLEEATTAARQFLKHKPQGVVCATDLQALGVLAAARELGISCPRDLAVTGFDDLPAARWATPGLTTWVQDVEAMGRASLAKVFSPPDPAPSALPGRLIERASSHYKENV